MCGSSFTVYVGLGTFKVNYCVCGCNKRFTLNRVHCNLFFVYHGQKHLKEEMGMNMCPICCCHWRLGLNIGELLQVELFLQLLRHIEIINS